MYCLLYTSEPPFQIWIKPLASKPANMKTAGWPYRKGFQRTRLRTAQDLAAGDQPYACLLYTSPLFSTTRKYSSPGSFCIYFVMI